MKDWELKLERIKSNYLCNYYIVYLYYQLLIELEGKIDFSFIKVVKNIHLSTKGMMQFGGSEERPSPSLLSSRLQKIYNFTFPSTSPFTPPLHPSNQTHPNSYHEQLESFVVRSQLPKKNCYFVREPNWKFSKEKKIILQATILTKNKKS